MLSSAVMKHHHHVGLQKVSVLSGLARSSLGPCPFYKFIHQEGGADVALACCCVRLLDSLELSCAVGQLVSESVRSHHGAFRSGSACLLFMAGAWSRGALECVRRGIPAPRVVSAMREGLDICLQACRTHSIPVVLPRSPSVSGPAGTPQHNGAGPVRLTRSRYFCGAPSHRDLGPTARALSHGHDASMELVLQAARLQAGGPGFDVGKVVTCVVPGVSEEQACVLPGWVVRLPAEKVLVSQQVRGQCLRVALITGDLCGRYRHLGFKRPPGVSHVTERLDLGGPSREAQWTESVLTSLRRLGVNLVLVSGAVGESLSPRCLTQRILLVDRVRLSVLTAVAEATGAVPVTYAAQLSERCVGTGVTVTPWRDLGDRQTVHISAAGLVTAVLTSCVPARLQALEDGFWACAHRLHGALQDGAVLPGAGLVETLCIHALQERGPPGLYRDTVLKLMADALTDYVATVMANSGRCSKLHSWAKVGQTVKSLGGLSEDKWSGVLQAQGGLGGDSGDAAHGRVYDNLSVKLEAWRRAMDLVLLVLQTDAEVITGVDPEALQTDTDLMLL